MRPRHSSPLRSLALGLALGCAGLSASLTVATPAAHAEQVIETADDGTVSAKYNVDSEGRMHGTYAEFHADGSIKLKANYRRGRLHGNYVTYHASGRPHIVAAYKNGDRQGKYLEKDERGRVVIETTYNENGRLDGAYIENSDGEPLTRQQWEDGEPVLVDGVIPYPRTRDQIRDEIEEIYNHKDPLEGKEGDTYAQGRGEALRHLMIFRYLAGLVWRDMVLVDRLNAVSDAGAGLCERIGRLDHTPANPGMPEDEYKFAYEGTSRGNLFMGSDNIVTQVRAYMDDSDASNIDKVGHRRWCLNPRMLKVGFGQKGKFGAMYAHDNSRTKVPDFEYAAFPAQGYYPAYWFGSHYAWSVSLNRRHFSKPDPSQVKVTVTPIGADHVKRGEPLELNHLKVRDSGSGIPYIIIFRPAGIDTSADNRFWVEISGLEKGSKPFTLRYVTSFFEL